VEADPDYEELNNGGVSKLVLCFWQFSFVRGWMGLMTLHLVPCGTREVGR